MMSDKAIIALLIVAACYAGILILGNFWARILAATLMLALSIISIEWQHYNELAGTK